MKDLGSPRQEETLLDPVWLKVEEVYSQNKASTGALFEENSWFHLQQRIAIWETNPGRLCTLFLVFSSPSQTLAKNYARKIQLIQPYIIRRESDFEKRYYKKKKVKERNKTYCQKKKMHRKYIVTYTFCASLIPGICNLHPLFISCEDLKIFYFQRTDFPLFFVFNPYFHSYLYFYYFRHILSSLFFL